jgi:hypothetical protein
MWKTTVSKILSKNLVEETASKEMDIANVGYDIKLGTLAQKRHL